MIKKIVMFPSRCLEGLAEGILPVADWLSEGSDRLSPIYATRKHIIGFESEQSTAAALGEVTCYIVSGAIMGLAHPIRAYKEIKDLIKRSKH